MEKTIKYLENGEYHYATVKDVGDLAKLKTDSKDDLVTAINELFVTGGDAPKKPEGYDKLVDNVADAIQKQKDISGTIDDMQQNAQLTETEMAHIKQEQEKAYQEYLQAVKELNDAINKTKSDAENLDKKTSDLQNKLDETFANVEKEVSDVHKQLDSESAGLRKDLDDTKTSLESTRKDLLNNTQEFGVVNSEVKELKDKMDRRIWSTDLDPVREQVNKNATEVSQTKDELKNKADQSSLDLVTNSVENLSTQIKENAEGLKVAVKRDELGGDVARLLNDKTNLLLGTRSFSGEDNWKNRDTATTEPGYYKGLKSAAIQSTDSSIYQPYHIKANTAYTFSFFGKEDKDNPQATLIIKPIDAPNINIDNAEQPVHITTEWQRFAVTFSADQDCDISIQIIQGPEASNNILHLAGFKLQYGQNNTPWEPNEADVAENIEHNESQFNVYSDQIAGIVKKQEKIGDTERQLDTRITETAEGLKQTSKDLQDANGKITEFKGQLESTARGLKTEYEKYTNDAIGQISDSSLNLIRNSSFSNGEDELASWQNVSAKATVKEDNNNLHWIELTQTGQSTDNPIGITSNYFIVKQGKVTVAVDIKLGDKANLDNQNILLLELYNDAKQRVDFADVSLEQLGLSMDIVGDHNVHRGLFRLGIDRKDVKYMTVKAILHRNGDIWLTNFSARLSSIDDGGYTPNPDDLNQQILKMNTKIEEDAEHIALKANSVDVTRDIKSAVDGIQVGGRNLLKGTSDCWRSLTGSGWLNSSTASDMYTSVADYHDGDQFTYSAIITNPSTVPVRLVLYCYDAGKQEKIKTALGPIVGPGAGAKAVSVTVTTDWRTWFLRSNIESLDGKSPQTTIQVKNEQLEFGNVRTSWTPNPQDTSDEIKSAKDAAIQVASDQINIHVNELSTSFDDKLNKRVNEAKTASEKFTSDGIEQTVRKITDIKNDVNARMNNLQIGGRNYLRDSDKSTAGWAQDLGTMPNEVLNSLAGKTVTVSCDVEWSNFQHDGQKQNRLGFELSVSGSDGQGYWLGAWEYPSTPNGKERVYATYTLPQGVTFTVTNNGQNGYVSINGTGKVSHAKIEVGTKAADWSPAPEDINQSIKDATEYKTVTGTIDFNNLKTQQKIFYKDLQATNAPAGGNYWYYLDVEPGYDGRILQTAVSDRDNITWVRTFADSWSPWVKQADQRNVDDLNNQINGFKTETTASVKNLGDRVTTEVNSITTRQNNFENETKAQHSNDVELVRKSDFEDGSKGGWTVQAVVSATNPAPPAELGQSGMKVLQTNVRDAYEDGIWYSVKPDEKFDVDYWCAPSSSFHTTFGLVFADKDKQVLAWGGINSDQSGQWKHYTGTITAPANAAFAKAWYQMEKPADNTADTSWIAKPHVRRQNPQVAEKISELNTKWEVANGQIQGKVTETQVNDILNGKGYATQSWAQTMFQMKSDSITLQAVRDNITNGIQDQVNGINNKIDTQTLDSADINNMRTQGHYFVRNLANSPISGWVYVDITGNNNDRLKQDVYQDSGYEHRSRRWFDNSWTEWTTDVNNKNVISQINITPESLKLSSNKIEIDGNTSIHGTLSVPEVRLQGKSGMIGLDGNSGIIISSADTLFQTRVTRYGMDFLTSTNGKKEIVGGITTGANANDNNINGISIVLDTGQKLGDPYGGDFFSIGSTTSIKNNDDRTWSRAMDYDASGSLHEGGFMWYEHSTLASEGKQIRIDGANDPLYISATKFGVSAQPNYYQPTIRAGWNENTMSNAGIGFLWNQVKPFGNWDISDMDSLWFNGQEFKFTWVSHPSMMGNMRVPSFVKVDPNGGISSGICFAPGSVWSIGATGSGNITRNLLF